MISQSERDRAEYEVQLKRQRDLINRDQLIRGHALEEGREEGRQLWQLVGSIRTLTQLLCEPVPTDEELSQLPLAVLVERDAECRRRLRERGIPL